MILAILSLWQQPIEISRSTDRRQLGIMLPIGVMIRNPAGGGGGGDATTLNGENGAYYLDRANHTGTQAIGTIDGLQTALDSKIESVAWGDIAGTLSDQTDLQDALNLKLDAADYNDRFLGLYASLFDLQAAHPTASAGDYAQVDLGIGTDVIVYAWDVNDAKWAAVGSSAIANTDALPEGSTNLYHTSQRVRDTTLTGFTLSSSPITATDSIVQAFGKAQGQLNSVRVSDGFDFYAYLGDRWLNQEVTNNLVYFVAPWAQLHNSAIVPAAYNTTLSYILLDFDLCAFPTASASGDFVVLINGNIVNSTISGALSNTNYFAKIQLQLFRRATGGFGYLLRSSITGAPLFRGSYSPVTPIPLGVDISVEVRWRPANANQVEHISTTNCTLAVKLVQNGV